MKHFWRMLVLLSILNGSWSFARQCEAPLEAPSLSTVDSEIRLQFISHQLDTEIHRLQIWSVTWGSIYATAMVTQLSVLPFVSDHGTKVDLAVGAIAAGVGSASLFALPQRIIQPARWVRKSFQEPDRCRLLAESERRFAEAAKLEDLGRSWIAHVGNIVVNTTLFLVLGVAYHRWTSAVISGAVGFAIGETDILTQPHGLGRALEQYRMGALGDLTPGEGWSVAPVLTLGQTVGLGLLITF